MSFQSGSVFTRLTAWLCVGLMFVATAPVAAQDTPIQQGTAPPATISAQQLESLVAPIALYPDPLLAQMLVASTYPLEVIQLQQWLDRNKDLKGDALTQAVEQQNWDPSVQALAVLPDVVKILSENISWTTDLGNTFLAQQNDVMDAVQRMRAKAKNGGKLQSTPQQTVETKVIEDKTVVVIEPASPDVIYVPAYDPMVVYGVPAYPYPPMYYPPGWYPGAGAIGFGVGLAIGAAWGGGGWGWNCGWGGNNNININNNNNFINHNNQINNLKSGNRPTQQGGGQQAWKHNPEHRGGTPYGNRDVANKYGGTARGDSMANRQAAARQNPGNFGGGNQGGFRDVSAGANRGGGNFGGDRAGSRDVSRGSGNGAFGGASGGNRSNARASQSRGSSSMSRGSSGGGRSRGGGGGGGRRR